ncbi:hypothetical protein HMPREF1252_0256 [Peptoniphilus sp. BV3AC2]|nr:hypothetical protein HMPREF1252_0256 [Peptoniphilus sp. BV3AC2]
MKKIDLEKTLEVKMQIEELHRALNTLTKEERELIATPPALIGRWFYENVNKRLVKNVEHIGKAEDGVEKYKRI